LDDVAELLVEAATLDIGIANFQIKNSTKVTPLWRNQWNGKHLHGKDATIRWTN